MDRIRIWPHAALIVLGVAIIAGAAAVFWTKYERSAEAKSLPNAARIERVDGQVGLNHSLDNTSNTQWVAATANTPISVGDRLYTRDNSRSEIAFTGRNFATVDGNSSLDILNLSNERTQVALRTGSALFDVGSLGSGQLFEVATPCGAIDLQQPGVYRVAIDDNGNATATAFSGQAQVVGQGGSSLIQKGEVLTVPCQNSTGAAISRVNYDQAGSLLDSYYHYRYPRTYDGRYRNYYTYLDDPYYYDPYSRYNSYNYVSDYVPGIDDLDDYGDWQYVSDYGYAWHPRVDTGWAPYQSGYWMMDYPYGLTWVSTEPWGYAPYHYGRWTYVSNDWFWIPEATSGYPTYSPALVAFLPLGQSSLGWVALGPGDPYTSWYYDPYWQPVYLTSPTVIEQRIVNISVPGAVTVIPAQDFGQVIDPRIITRVDPQTIASVQPVLDPLTVDPLRQAAFQTRQAQRRIDVPQAIAQRINNTPVVTATAPVAPPFKGDLASALRVQQLPNQLKNQKLQLRDERSTAAQQAGQPQAPTQAPNAAAEQARERQMADLARQAARGDRTARQQMQELRRQQLEQQRAERVAAQQAQGERVRQQMQQQQQDQRQAVHQQQQAQREAARQQMITTQQLRRAATQQQIETQRAARRQAEIQRAQQPTVRHAPQAQPIRPVAPPQRRETKPPVQYQQPQAQPRVMSAPRPQPQAQPRPQPQPQPKPQAQPHPPPQAQPQPQPQAQPKPQAQPHPPPQAQPQPQPERGGPPKAPPQPEQKGGRKKP